MDQKIIPPDIQLQTDQVLLVPLGKSHADPLYALARGDESMWTYFSLNLSDRLQFESWMAAAFSDKTAGTRRPFTIIDKLSGQIAGSMSIGNISLHDLRLEIGWSWLGREFRGTEVNRHAKFCLLQYAFESLHCERVEFKTDVLNQRARRGLEKIGGKQEGVLRSHMTMWNNRRRDSVYYSILKNEWHGLRQTIFKDINTNEDH